MEERTALLALSRIRGMGNDRKRRVVDNCESVAALFEGKAKGAEGFRREVAGASSVSAGIDGEMARLSAMGVDIVTIKDDTYPPLLREIPDAPIVFYKKGPLPLSGPWKWYRGCRKGTQ